MERQKEKELILLSWKVKELNDLGKIGRDLHSKFSQLRHSMMQHGQSRWREDNIPRQLKNIRDKTVAFITGLTRHQRTPVTHVLVFMQKAICSSHTVYSIQRSVRC